MATRELCPIPYPERFHAAVEFVASPHSDGKVMTDEFRLLLFALHKQATQGQCNEPKPWSWNVVETAKWQGWNQLGDMSKEDAMRHYVGQLDQQQPDWWRTTDQGSSPENDAVTPEANGIEKVVIEKEAEAAVQQKARVQKILDASAEGSWSTPYLSNASKPLPRYEHGVTFARDEMYLIGGNCGKHGATLPGCEAMSCGIAGGRYTNDVWSFNFTSLCWSPIACQASADEAASPLPPIAGHSVIHWKNCLLVVGGHVKSKDATEKMVIRSLNLDNMTWSMFETKGKAPVSRGGHSATLIGDKLCIFGGEDVARRPLNDFHLLNLESHEWKSIGTVKNAPPSARSAHVSTTYQDRYLIYFGGGSMATCFDDIVVFDTERLRWHSPTVKGRKPSPRAGHSAAMLGNRWYIVGGGNNASGCTDMAYLDFSQLSSWPSSAVEDDDSEEGGYPEGPDLDDIEYELKWTIVGTIPERSYLASEGMSLISIQDADVLVAFGGYNGRYSNAVSLFRPRELSPAQDTYTVPSALSGRLDSEQMDPPTAQDGESADQKVQNLQAQLDALTKNASTAKEAAVQELGIMRRQLLSAQAVLQEKDAALTETKAQLTEQQAKTFKLQAEAAEMKANLEKVNELEKELEIYRRKVPGGKQSGIWGWVAGE